VVSLASKNLHGARYGVEKQPYFVLKYQTMRPHQNKQSIQSIFHLFYLIVTVHVGHLIMNILPREPIIINLSRLFVLAPSIVHDLVGNKRMATQKRRVVFG